jgi:deoxyribodipyrimidine photolyase-related protein
MALQVKNVARLSDAQKQAVHERAAAIRAGEVGVDARVGAAVGQHA